MSAAAPALQPPRTLGELARRLPDWLRHHLPATIVSIVVGGLVSYVSNVWLMFVRYGGWQKVPPGSPATGAGNLVGGALFWGLATSVVVGAVSYWRTVGTRRFFHEMRTLPATLAGLVRRDGQGARIHLLWGAAVSLLVAQIVSPSAGALMAVGLAAVTPGPLGNIVTSGISRLAFLVVGRVTPDRKIRPLGTLAVAVGVLGSAAALIVGYFVTSHGVKWLLAAAAAGGAIALSRAATGKPPTAGAAAGVILLAALGAVAADLLHPLLASANDGGEAECGIRFYQVGAWLSQCDGSHAVLSHAVGGGLAGAVGAPIGAFVGSVAGLMPPGAGPLTGPGDWPDGSGPTDGGGTGPVVPDWFGPGRVTVRVKGNSIIITAANGVEISAPILSETQVGQWTYSGTQSAPGPDMTPPAEPSVLDPGPPPPEVEPYWPGLDDGGAGGAGADTGPPPGPPAPAAPAPPQIDLGAVAQALNQLDWEITDPNLYAQLQALQGQLAGGNFGPDQLAALMQLQTAQNGFADTRLSQILTDRQNFADQGMYGPNGLLAAEQASLVKEAQQRALQAQIDKQDQYISDHMDDLPLGQFEAAQRILDRTETNDSPNADTLGQLRQLSASMFNTQQGASMAAGADAANSAAWSQLGMDIASNIQTGASVAEAAILFPFVVPGASAAAADLGAFYLGRNLVQGLATGYAEGGVRQALINGTKAVLPVNLINAIYNQESAGSILLATLQDIGNVAQLDAAAEALHNMGPISVTFGEHPPPLQDPAAHNVVTTEDTQWAASRSQGQDNVTKFKDLNSQLAGLEPNSAQAQQVKDELQNLVYDMNGDFQSKSALKDSPLEVQAAFNDVLNPALTDAHVGTVEALNEVGLQRGGRPIVQADLTDLRNASSAGTVGMDRDLALNQMAERQLSTQLQNYPPGSAQHTEISQALQDLKNGDLHITSQTHPTLTDLQARGLLTPGTVVQGPVLPGQNTALLGTGESTLQGGTWTMNGQPVSADEARAIAQDAYNRAYQRATGTAAMPGGRDPVAAMQGVTDATHVEAYQDLGVLKNDPLGTPFDPRSADQTGSVTSVKGYEATKPDGPFQNNMYNAFQEVARGTAKDIDSKLLPLLQANNAPPGFVSQVQDMRNFLGDVKAGNLSPSQAQALAQARFGTDIQGLANRVDAAIATTVKLGPPPPTGWAAMSPGTVASSAAGTGAQFVSGVAGAPPTQVADPNRN